MARFYGFKVWDVEQLTFVQLNEYLSNLPYVADPMGKEFGKPPEIMPPTHPLVAFAERCGILVPYNVRYDIVTTPPTKGGGF